MTTEDLSLLEVANRIPPNRRIMIKGFLSNADAENIRLNDLKQMNRAPGDILAAFNSKGGESRAGFVLQYHFRRSPNRVIGLVDGEASSSAFIALQGCRVRLMTPGSRLVIHNPESYTPEVAITHVISEEEYIEKQRTAFRQHKRSVMSGHERTIAIILERSLMKDPEEVALFLETNLIMDAKEALTRGFIDEIVKN